MAATPLSSVRSIVTWFLLQTLTFLILLCPWAVLSFLESTVPHKKRQLSSCGLMSAAVPTWDDIESMLGSPYKAPLPVSIDSVLHPENLMFSSERPCLFRERHGWCPYSERVWLTLELKNVEYDTVRIDNTGAPRPKYFHGQTPQLRWPDGRMQGESLDLVRDLDAAYDSPPFLFKDSEEAEYCISQFRSIFPSRARPSSRAAFLFQGNGDPLWKGVFEETLRKTDELLGKNEEGPFFCGSDLSAADVAWAPFLERYRYQLPCLHDGLDPNDSAIYPNLATWYSAMDEVPAYACRVKGDASSWRKVLSMAGFGNAFVPPQIEANMEELERKEASEALSIISQDTWVEYASSRPYLADSPQAEAALAVTRNREAILVDTLKRAGTSFWKDKGLATSETKLDESLRAMVRALLEDGNDSEISQEVLALFAFLDQRMCVPRDMGAMSASAIKQFTWKHAGAS